MVVVGGLVMRGEIPVLWVRLLILGMVNHSTLTTNLFLLYVPYPRTAGPSTSMSGGSRTRSARLSYHGRARPNTK